MKCAFLTLKSGKNTTLSRPRMAGSAFRVFAHCVDESDDVFREEITRGSLAAEDEASSGHIRLRIAPQPQIESDDVKDSQMLSLVLVDTLHLHIKHGLGCEDDAGPFGNERCKPTLVNELRGAPLVLKLWIIGKRFELAKLVQVAQPAVADTFGNDLGKAGITDRYEAAGCHAVCHVAKFLRP
jgi:hypothetical protein